MTSAGRVLRDASRRVPDAEARLLLAHALGVPASKLLTLGDLDTDAVDGFEQLLTRREAGIPVQYLTGRAPFRHVDVAVGPGVFIPRPETEVMTGWALDRLAEVGESPLVVELCAGSGAISLAIADEYPSARQYAVELSEDAVGYAARNLAGTGVELIQADMADALPELDGTVDLVIANPPYIPLEAWEQVAVDVRTHEPELALFSGADGLDALAVVARVAARLLRPGGLVCAEHAEVQSEAVVGLFAAAGTFVQVADNLDYTRRPRYVTAVRAPKLAG